MTVELISTNGIAFLIDEEDVEKVSKGVWWVWNKRKDAKRNRTSYVWWNYSRGVPSIKLHRYIMDAPEGLEVDHINGNGLDNRRCNLRLVTGKQNKAAMKKTSVNKSGFKGVCWHKAAKRWVAQFRPDDGQSKSRHLGCFKTAEEAARAYDEAVYKEYGDIAALNFPRTK